jgi:hypothetical protein
MDIFKRLPDFLKIHILSYRPTHPNANLVKILIPLYDFYKTIIDIDMYERIIASNVVIYQSNMEERISQSYIFNDAIKQCENFYYYYHKQFKMINSVYKDK